MNPTAPSEEPPPVENAEERWDRARARLLASPLGALTFEQIGTLHPVTWPTTWNSDSLGKYLALSLHGLHCQRGIGKERIRMLQSLAYKLESTLPAAPSAAAAATAAAPSSWPVSAEQTLVSVLEQSGIPENFPMWVTFFSARVKDFAAARGCSSIYAFTRYLAVSGQDAATKHKNFGRASHAAISRYVQALKLADRSLLREFLPLGATSGQLDLGTFTRMTAETHDHVDTAAMRERLVFRRTLEEVARATGVTRERIRQVEKLLLKPVAEFLDCLPELRTALWEQWTAQGNLTDISSDEPVEIRELAAAAVTRIFADSPEGVRQEADLSRQVADLFDALREEPAYYTGLALADYFDARSTPQSLRAAFLEECERRPRLFYDAASGVLKAGGLQIKPVVAALLRRGVVQADEILAWLGKAPELSLTLGALRRNWLNWKCDPDFPTIPIEFPSRSSAFEASARLLTESDGVFIDGEAVPSRAAARQIDAELLEFDRQLAEMINAQESPVICDLLPAPADFPVRVLEALRRDCAGDPDRLESALSEAPAAAVYGMVAALSGAEAPAIWEPLAKGIGIAIPLPRRSDVALAFGAAVREAGLVDCSSRQADGAAEDVGGAWAIAFQAGITPQFIKRFAAAIRAELATGAAPDLADDAAMQRFAAQVAERLPANVRRPRLVLISAAGITVCRTVLAALKSGNFDALPADWREPLQAEIGQWASRSLEGIRGPSLGFSPDLGIFVDLPAQPEKIRRASTHWLVRETGARYPADEPTRLSGAALPAGTITLALKQLQLEIESPVFKMPAGPSVDEPVMIFVAPAGKWMRGTAAGDSTIQLPVGRDYFLVIAEEAQTDLEEESWSVTEHGLRWVSYVSFWNQVSVVISCGSVTAKISPCQGASLLVQPDAAGSRLVSAEGHLIYAGTCLTGVIAIPGAALLTGDSPRMDVPELGLSALSLELSAAGNADSQCAAFPAKIAQALAGLPPGIHRLNFVVRGIRRALRQPIYFWKGLQHVSPDDGFACQGLANIDLNRLEGLRPAPHGLAFESEHGHPIVRIFLQNPPIRLSLARPGLSVELLQDGTSESEVLAGATLRVRDDDQKVIRFSANLSSPGSLLVDGRPWRKFSRGTSAHSTRLASLLQPGAAMAAVAFEQADGRQTRLFRAVRERVFNHVWFDDDEVEDRYYLRLGLPRESTPAGLALRAWDLLDAANPEPAAAALPIEDGTHVVKGANGIEFVAIIRLLAHERIVELLIAKPQFAGKFIVMDLAAQSIDGQWEPLPASNGHEAGSARWVAHAPGTLGAAPLAKLLSNPKERIGPQNIALTAAEWSDAFKRLHPLIHATYAHPFWDHLEAVRSGYLTLGRIATSTNIARESVFDLARQSALSEIRFRPVLFAAQSEIVALPAEFFRLPSYPAGHIGHCFELAGLLDRERSIEKVLATRIGELVDIWPLATFQAHPGTKDRPIAVAGFLSELDRALRHAPTVDSDSDRVFSPASWGQAFRQIRRRIERLRRAAPPGAESPQLSALRRFAQRRHRASGRIDHLLGVQAARLACEDLSFDEQSCEVASLTLLVTAAGRLTAHGYLSPETFRELMSDLFQKTNGDHDSVGPGYALLLHFSPELFASFFVLWEFACHAIPSSSPRHA